MLLNIIFLNTSGLFEEMRQWLLLMLLGLGVLLTGLVVVLLIKELISGGYIRAEAGEAHIMPSLELEEKAQPAPLIPSAAAHKNKDESELVAAIAGAISAHTGRPLSTFRVVRFQERV